MMRRLFTFCATGYLLIYAFEGAIRFGLHSTGTDSAILLRDALIGVPLVLLLTIQTFRRSIHPAFVAFAGIVVFHGAISTFNLHTTLPAVYGAKLLINVLFGFIAARQLTQPGRRTLLLLALVWIISATGVVLDKFIYTMPWTGLHTDIGGIQVDISRGWDIESGFDKRAAGFTRSSISGAMLLPIIALLIAPRVRSVIIRFTLVAITAAVVTLTTQKGSMVAIAAVGAILCTPRRMQYNLLCTACFGFALLDVVLPLFTAGLLMPDSGGVFSLASFAMRITLTWPDAWRWILNNDVFPFGVGLGGIGGAQRFYAPNAFNPSDNFFIFLYANFGVFSLLYMGWSIRIGRGLPDRLKAAAIVPLSLLTFNFAYGTALSMLEDQVSALFIGASVGMLWQLRELARAGQWTDPYLGAHRLAAPLDGSPSPLLIGQASRT